MKFEIEPFDNYFVSAAETETELLDSGSPFVAALRRYHVLFEEHVFAKQGDWSISPCLLAMHASMTYLASLRVAFSGHAAAAFPLFRTALESACYAFLTSEDDELARTWLDRNGSEKALKLCRRNSRLR